MTERSCACTTTASTTDSLMSPHCQCPRNDLGIVVHDETCLMWKNEQFVPVREGECVCLEGLELPTSDRSVDGVCHCCGCVPCRCNKAGREVFDEWRSNREIGALPAVLESTHPLMQKFQETLRQFLEKENAIAEEQIQNLRDELKLSKQGYDRDLEAIYHSDHDTNSQRVLIEEYENNLAHLTAERVAAEDRAREANDAYKRSKEKLESDQQTEREATEEVEALTTLVKQLEKWQEETESDLTVSQRMNEKMRAEKRALAEEKRELDMILFAVGQEVWKLQSKIELFKKQLEIKNVEMENINDKVTAYAAELEDLELDKRRLVSLWNAVVVNIKQRDNVYDSVRDDYKTLQENYRTLIINLDITKKLVSEEMNKGKQLEMYRDKSNFDIEHATKIFEAEDAKRIALEGQIVQYTDSVEMTERDIQMISMENQAMKGFLKSTEKEVDMKTEKKIKLENEILQNLQDCLLNDKAVEAMANGIKKMREISRKQEISLMGMEKTHAKIMLDIEVNKSYQLKNTSLLTKTQEKVREREKELQVLQDDYDERILIIMRKQRELDILMNKHMILKEIFNMKSPQERRIEELENQIKTLREKTESMQHEWLRLQGHVVRLAGDHQKLLADINLSSKQIQICDQKTMRIQADCEMVNQEKDSVDRALRELRSKLEVLERTRKDSLEKNDSSKRANMSLTHMFSANLKGAETEILELEEEIEMMDKEKMNLSQELDRITREAMIWQRKGILAVELKNNMKQAKSAAGEIGQMRTEIHRMEVRSEQLRRMGEKLSEDLAQYVTRRGTAMEKSRSSAAIEKTHGSNNSTSQSSYHHKLRLARSDVARVTKDLSEAEERLKYLQGEQERLDREVDATSTLNAQIEEQIATLIRECIETDKQKQWLLERVVRSQRLGSELATAIKRKNVRVRKPKATVIDEYCLARSLNGRLRYIVECLTKEYPHYGDKLEAIANTLNIYTPGNSPRFTEEGTCPVLLQGGVCVIQEMVSKEVAPEGECYCEKEGSPSCSSSPKGDSPKGESPKREGN